MLGLLYAAPAVGSLAATVTSGWAARVHRHGAAVCVAAAVWGVGIIGFGLAPNLGLALLGLVVAGGADMVSGIFRGTIWNQTIPDHLRGRLAGIEQVSYSTGPLLGNVESGAVARSPACGRRSSRAACCASPGWPSPSSRCPAFWRYDARNE